MTFADLSKLIKKYNIPKDVTLMSDSGWECDRTDMDGAYYNPNENTIAFVQYPYSSDKYFTSDRWFLLYGERRCYDAEWINVRRMTECLKSKKP